jgi:TonB family protein
MRHRLAILIPFLLLAAACEQLGIGGGGNESENANADGPSRDEVAAAFERPGGGFDRERFRTFSQSLCGDSFTSAPVGPSQGVEALCACAANRLLAQNDDNALRAMLRDEELGVSKQFEAQDQCMNAPDDAAAGPAPPASGPARARAPNLATYLSAADYPAAALRNNEQGRVAFTLDIGPNGRVTNCSIRESSGSATLDSTTCRIMRSRARYTPARDARGVAVADRHQSAVTWVLPGG